MINPFDLLSSSPMSWPVGSGVYRITCGGDPKSRAYIGSSVTLRSRWRGHRSDLMRGRHHSRHLQRVFAIYGGSVTVEVLELVAADQLLSREQHWIDTLKPALNSAKVAGSCIGVRHTTTTKQRMSEAARQRHRNNPMHVVAAGSAAWAGLAPEVRESRAEALRTVLRNMPEEAKARKRVSLQAAVDRRAPEAEAARRDAIRAGHAARSEAQKVEHYAKMVATRAARTPEQKAAHAAKVWETRRRNAAAKALSSNNPMGVPSAAPAQGAP